MRLTPYFFAFVVLWKVRKKLCIFQNIMLKRVLAALFRIVYFDYIGETIVGNCSCVLFLGGKEQSTLKEISETLGKETIDLYNTSDTRGSQRSMGVNYQKLGKDMP